MNSFISNWIPKLQHTFLCWRNIKICPRYEPIWRGSTTAPSSKIRFSFPVATNRLSLQFPFILPRFLFLLSMNFRAKDITGSVTPVLIFVLVISWFVFFFCVSDESYFLIYFWISHAKYECSFFHILFFSLWNSNWRSQKYLYTCFPRKGDW